YVGEWGTSFLYSNGTGGLSVMHRTFGPSGSTFAGIFPVTVPPPPPVVAIFDDNATHTATRDPFEMALPDNDDAGVSDAFIIEGDCDRVAGIMVSVNATHDWPADISVFLTPPGSTDSYEFEVGTGTSPVTD